MERLAGGKVDPEKALPNLPECVAVTKTDEYGTCTAWLDPRHGFLPKRIEIRKSGDDKLGHTPINKIAPRDDGPRALWPNTQMTEFHQVVDSISFADFEGVPIMQKLTDTWTYSYEKEQRITMRHEFSAEDFHLPKPMKYRLRSRCRTIPSWSCTASTTADINGITARLCATRRWKIRVRNARIVQSAFRFFFSGEPMPGAKIHAAVWGDPAKSNQDYLCDDEGRARSVYRVRRVSCVCGHPCLSTFLNSCNGAPFWIAILESTISRRNSPSGWKVERH